MIILFQGDSITDASRDRNNPKSLGMGFVNLIASRLMCDYPDVDVINRGIGGNRISDMYGRWIEDTLNIKYDVLNIMCGINDIGFGLRRNTGADDEKFRFVYDRMIFEAMEKNPDAVLVLAEPYLMKLEREQATGNEDIVDDWEIWNGEMLKRRKTVRELAKKYNAIFVPFGEMFDDICKTTPAIRWTADGIHPTPAGAELMARKWMEVVLPQINL